jgi:hypothetical protein
LRTSFPPKTNQPTKYYKDIKKYQNKILLPLFLEELPGMGLRAKTLEFGLCSR